MRDRLQQSASRPRDDDVCTRPSPSGGVACVSPTNQAAVNSVMLTWATLEADDWSSTGLPMVDPQ
jgi:hypothetical protein